MSQSRKNDFPIFARRPELCYLDSAAMAEMPTQVIDAVRDVALRSRANVHRGIYPLSEEATEAYESARARVAKFVNARPEEIIFTKNATDSLNLVARSLGRLLLAAGDRILISRAEHHSNFLPWRAVAAETGAILDVLDPDETGAVSREAVQNAVTPRTKIAALSHVSHVSGAENPIAAIGAYFRKEGIRFVVDGAQSVAHMPIDVNNLSCDFFAFSGHKIGGPTGIGVLYGRRELLETLEPVSYGGGMVLDSLAAPALWHGAPARFEAGTPNVEGAVGLSAAVDYIEYVGFDAIREVDRARTREILDFLSSLPGVRVYGPASPEKRGAVVSFSVDGVHPHDLAAVLAEDGVCIRAGHHCAMPLMEFFGVPALSRASVWIYNDRKDTELFSRAVARAIKMLRA